MGRADVLQDIWKTNWPLFVKTNQFGGGVEHLRARNSIQGDAGASRPNSAKWKKNKEKNEERSKQGRVKNKNVRIRNTQEEILRGKT